jgi:tetratricopeptide (TPR) repeat protein
VLKACKHALCFACLKDWQTYSTNNAGLFAAQNAAASCPYCRQESEKSVVEDAVENARLFTARARRLQKNDPDRKKYFDLALAEVDKLLEANERDLPALFFKGQILAHYAPVDAIQVYKKVLALDQEGSANLEKLEAMQNAVKVAMDAGDEDDVFRLAGSVEAYKSSGVFIGQIGFGPRRLIMVMIYLAEAHEALGNWGGANAIYGELIQEASVNSSTETRKLLAGLSRCMFQLGFYDLAVQMGEGALLMNRHVFGVHKLIALPQLALGQVEAARTTMRRGVVYKAPWDDEDRQENIAFLEECLRDQTAKKGGV